MVPTWGSLSFGWLGAGRDLRLWDACRSAGDQCSLRPAKRESPCAKAQAIGPLRASGNGAKEQGGEVQNSLQNGSHRSDHVVQLF